MKIMGIDKEFEIADILIYDQFKVEPECLVLMPFNVEVIPKEVRRQAMWTLWLENFDFCNIPYECIDFSEIKLTLVLDCNHENNPECNFLVENILAKEFGEKEKIELFGYFNRKLDKAKKDDDEDNENFYINYIEGMERFFREIKPKSELINSIDVDNRYIPLELTKSEQIKFLLLACYTYEGKLIS